MNKNLKINEEIHCFTVKGCIKSAFRNEQEDNSINVVKRIFIFSEIPRSKKEFMEWGSIINQSILN